VLGISTTRASVGKQRVLVKWHGSCRYNSGSLLPILQERKREVRLLKSEYDLNSAITFLFLLVGPGIGSALAMLFDPKQRVTLEGIKRDKGIDSWRTARLHQQEEANVRVA
jgi:hypothetical protein